MSGQHDFSFQDSPWSSPEETPYHSGRQSWSSTRDLFGATPSTTLSSLKDIELAYSAKHEKNSHSITTIRYEETTRTATPTPPDPEKSAPAPVPASVPASAPAPVFSGLHQVAFVFVVCSAQLLSLGGLNQTVAPVLILAKYFNVQDYGTLSWFSAAYSLTVGTFILPAGRLGDMYGHKRVYMVGWVWYSVWSIAAGACFSSNAIVFSICRAFQGIGPALLVPNAIALIGRTYPPGVQRSIVLACFGASGPIGATFGAIFTAVIAELLWWPITFWVLAAVCVIMLLLASFVIPGEELSAPAAEHQTFDYLGCLTGVAGLVLFNFALNQAPLVGWKTIYIIVTLVLGVVFFAAFILIELYYAQHPLIPLREVQAEAGFVLGCIAAGWGSHGIWAYYLYLFLEQVKHHDALVTSLETAPVAVTGVFFAFSTVHLLKYMHVSWVMLISMAFFVLGALLLALVPLNQTYFAQTLVSIILMPGAMNLSFPAATIMISGSLPREKQGIAASLVATMVNYSISCGLGFAGSVARYSDPKVLARHGFTGPPPALLDSLPGLDAARLECLKGPWWFAVALGGLGMLIASFSIIRRKWK